MELNFTDVSANPSIWFMDTKRCLSLPDDDHSQALSGPAQAADAAVEPTNLLRRWMRQASAVLARAEQRVTENFRVPPNGA